MPWRSLNELPNANQRLKDQKKSPNESIFWSLLHWFTNNFLMKKTAIR